MNNNCSVTLQTTPIQLYTMNHRRQPKKSRHNKTTEYASKAMKAAKIFQLETKQPETLEQLEKQLARYDLVPDSPVVQPKTPKPHPATLKLIEDTTIEMEREKNSISKLLAQLKPDTPTNKDNEDIDLDDIERRIAIMMQEDNKLKQEQLKNNVGDVYGLKKSPTTTQSKRIKKCIPESNSSTTSTTPGTSISSNKSRGLRVANARRNSIRIAKTKKQQKLLRDQREEQFLKKQSIVSKMEENQQILELLNSSQHIDDCSSENMFTVPSQDNFTVREPENENKGHSNKQQKEEVKVETLWAPSKPVSPQTDNCMLPVNENRCNQQKIENQKEETNNVETHEAPISIITKSKPKPPKPNIRYKKKPKPKRSKYVVMSEKDISKMSVAEIKSLKSKVKRRTLGL